MQGATQERRKRQSAQRTDVLFSRAHSAGLLVCGLRTARAQFRSVRRVCSVRKACFIDSRPCVSWRCCRFPAEWRASIGRDRGLLVQVWARRADGWRWWASGWHGLLGAAAPRSWLVRYDDFKYARHEPNTSAFRYDVDHALPQSHNAIIRSITYLRNHPDCGDNKPINFASPLHSTQSLVYLHSRPQFFPMPSTPNRTPCVHG